MRIVAFVVALSFGSCLVAIGSDSQSDKETLKGIKSLNVVVENLDASEISDGLTVSQIQTDVELRLRKAGLVVTADQTANGVFLVINANLLKVTDLPMYAFNIEVSLMQ